MELLYGIIASLIAGGIIALVSWWRKRIAEPRKATSVGKVPKLTLSLKGDGCAQGASHKAGAIYFRWNRELILHNDSPEIVRGIKLLSPFPKPWIMTKEVATRINADEKVSIPIKAEIDADHQKLLDRYGHNMQHRLGEAVFPSIVPNLELEFELVTEDGRTFYQYSKFNEDGTIKTEVSPERRE